MGGGKVYGRGWYREGADCLQGVSPIGRISHQMVQLDPPASLSSTATQGWDGPKGRDEGKVGGWKGLGGCEIK